MRYQTTSHQQRRISKTLAFIYCSEIGREHAGDISSNSITSTKKDFLAHLCSYTTERWKENMAEMCYQTTSHQQRSISNNAWVPSIADRWKGNMAEDATSNNTTSIQRGISTTLVYHLLLKDGKKTWQELWHETTVTSTKKDFHHSCVHLLLRNGKETW